MTCIAFRCFLQQRLILGRGPSVQWNLAQHLVEETAKGDASHEGEDDGPDDPTA
jgi:hypothetical protein